MMDTFSLVAAHLSAGNQPTFDPEEFNLAVRKADERRERWLERLAWLKLAKAMPRRNATPSIKPKITMPVNQNVRTAA